MICKESEISVNDKCFVYNLKCRVIYLGES
jgi:hypothetical protein